MKNTVELIGAYGSDEIIALSAWTSTSRELTEEKRKRIPGLINKLWNDGHETPFEKGMVHFLIECDIASHIHLLKHRIASINAESARYKELVDDKFYIPQDFFECKITSNNIDTSPLDSNWGEVLKNFTETSNFLYHECLKDLEKQFGRKRAKESARYFKLYNSQIQSDVMFNMRSFNNFLTLRNSEHAQVEIREIAQEMLRLVKETKLFDETLRAWGMYD
jgi:thymidylate synthase (FAD)